MILMNTLSSLGNLELNYHSGIYNNWKSLYNENQKKYNNFKEDIYEYRLPNGRNCEWGIKNSQLKRRYMNNYGELLFTDARERVLIEVEIVGTCNYLLYPNGGLPLKKSKDYYFEASLNHKIKYLKNTPWWEIEEDYLNWIEAPSTLKEQLRIVILPSSENILYSDLNSDLNSDFN